MDAQSPLSGKSQMLADHRHSRLSQNDEGRAGNLSEIKPRVNIIKYLT